MPRIKVDLEPDRRQVRVTVPYLAPGYTLSVYNVNDVGVSVDHDVRVWIRYWGADTFHGNGNVRDRRVEIRTAE